MDVSSRGCAHARLCAREDVRTAVFGKNIFLEKCIERMKILQSIYKYIYIYIYIIYIYIYYNILYIIYIYIL